MNNRKRIISRILSRDIRKLNKEYEEAMKSRINSETIKPLLSKMERVTAVIHNLNVNTLLLPAPVKKYDYTFFTAIPSDYKVKK